MRKALATAVLIGVLLSTASPVLARGGGGGGHASAHVSAPSRAPAVTRSATRVTTTTSKPAAPKISTRPTSRTVKVTNYATRTVNGKTYSKTGSVVDATYHPRFYGGYAPPIGSTVYYQESSWLDWLPFYMIMTNHQHQSAVVTEPSSVPGQPPVTKVVQAEGLDTMYIWNWVFSLLIVGGLIALIVWAVNRRYAKR